MRWLATLLLLTTLVGCQSFTDPLGRQDALEDSQKRYTDFVRRGHTRRKAEQECRQHGPE